MYLWVTCRLPEAFEREQRVSIRQAQEEAGLIRVEEPYLYCDLPTLVAETRCAQPYYLLGKA